MEKSKPKFIGLNSMAVDQVLSITLITFLDLAIDRSLFKS